MAEEEGRDDMQRGEIGEEETSFTEDRRRGDSYIIIDGSDLPFTRAGDTNESEGPGGAIPNVGKDVGVMKRSMIHDMKEFLKDGIGITVNKGDGDSSRDLFDNLRVVRSEKSGKISGAKYKGKKILFLKNGKMEYSTSKPNKPYVNEFKELLRKANIEHQKTPAAIAERQAGVDITQETMNSIKESVNKRIKSSIDSTVNDIATNDVVSENELREIRGLLKVKGRTASEKLEFVKIERDNWEKKVREEGNTSKGKLYESAVRIADLKADELRLELNQKPESEEVIGMVKEEAGKNDMTRFEKFKKWSRENLVSLSSLAISVAGVITTIIMAGRNALNKGGDMLKKFGEAVKNFIKKMWPILAPLGTIIAKIIELLAKLLVSRLSITIESEVITKTHSVQVVFINIIYSPVI